MLTLLPETQLASARLSPPAPFPAHLQGAAAPNEPTARSSGLGSCGRPASCHSAKNVCFMNELDLAHLEGALSLILRSNSFPTALPHAGGRDSRVQGELDLVELAIQARLNDRDVGERNVLYARHCVSALHPSP